MDITRQPADNDSYHITPRKEIKKKYITIFHISQHCSTSSKFHCWVGETKQWSLIYLDSTCNSLLLYTSDGNPTKTRDKCRTIKSAVNQKQALHTKWCMRKQLNLSITWQTSGNDKPWGMTRCDFTSMLLGDTTPITSDFDHGSDIQQTIAKVMAHWQNIQLSL